MTRILVIDNYDSFVYTIVGYLDQLGAETVVVRNDAVPPSAERARFDGILISPGPGTPAEAGAPYETIRLDKLTPIIGAEISGVDLANPSNRQMDEIHRALAENLVIFFRDQQLTQEQHLGFGRQFGELHIHPAAPAEPGHPELMIIKADKDSARANGEGWHSDVSCDEEPPLGSILYIKECPPNGGDTLFASMYAAYDALSDRMKAYLDGIANKYAAHAGISLSSPSAGGDSGAGGGGVGSGPGPRGRTG